MMLTEETRMRRHISTFKHLGDALERTHDTFDDLEGRLSALAEGVGQAVRIIWVGAHHARLAHSAIHPSQPSIHGAIWAAQSAAVDGVAHRAIPCIW